MELSEFIAQHTIALSVVQVSENPHTEGFLEGSFHYTCTLYCDGRAAEFPYSCGPALKERPTAKDVLGCLVDDARGMENSRVGGQTDFESWADEYGYDRDSRYAERIFHMVESHSSRLRWLLGEDHYETLLNEVEPE